MTQLLRPPAAGVIHAASTGKKRKRRKGRKRRKRRKRRKATKLRPTGLRGGKPSGSPEAVQMERTMLVWVKVRPGCGGWRDGPPKAAQCTNVAF
jgi:hypothetical protein